MKRVLFIRSLIVLLPFFLHNGFAFCIFCFFLSRCLHIYWLFSFVLRSSRLHTNTHACTYQYSQSRLLRCQSTLATSPLFVVRRTRAPVCVGFSIGTVALRLALFFLLIVGFTRILLRVYGRAIMHEPMNVVGCACLVARSRCWLMFFVSLLSWWERPHTYMDFGVRAGQRCECESIVYNINYTFVFSNGSFTVV